MRKNFQSIKRKLKNKFKKKPKPTTAPVAAKESVSPPPPKDSAESDEGRPRSHASTGEYGSMDGSRGPGRSISSKTDLPRMMHSNSVIGVDETSSLPTTDEHVPDTDKKPTEDVSAIPEQSPAREAEDKPFDNGESVKEETDEAAKKDSTAISHCIMLLTKSPPTNNNRLSGVVNPGRAKSEDAEAIKSFNQNKDIWMSVLSFVGPGHFAFVAGINHQMKKWYKEYVYTLEEPSEVGDIICRFGSPPKRQSVSSDTFYRAAFSSGSCADYWNKYRKEDNHILQCMRDGRVCILIARHGNLEALKWARQQGFGWCPGTCKEAAGNGHLEILRYAHEKGCQWNGDTCRRAAEKGHLECLTYAHEHGCPWDKRTCAMAASTGHLECLKYAHSHGCRSDGATCAWDALGGHLECLQYAHNNGCRWDRTTCAWAVRGGHLDCLKYAHESGCQWDEETCAQAAISGHLTILGYVRTNGCPWDERTHCYAREFGHDEVIEWVRNNGWPSLDE